VAGAAALGLPLAFQPLLVERDLRVRTHAGALGRFYLDALLGLVAVRAHAAERSLRRQHEGLLVEWARARLGLQRAAVAMEATQALVGYGLAAGILLGHVHRGGQVGTVLLLVYWALKLPVLSEACPGTCSTRPTETSC
jgi:ATP-binding cassette subfamily B protein